MHNFRILKSQLETKLYGARPMRIQRMQERGSGDAIGAAALEPRRVQGAGITANAVIAAAARVIGIVDTKLSMVEDVKSLSPELQFASLPNLEMFQQRNVEVCASRIIQEVSAR